MNESLQLKKLKKLSSQKENKEFTSFVIHFNQSVEFFTKLNKNLAEIKNARFQVAIKDGVHWWMVDCYIKNGELYTLTLDAVSTLNNLPNMMALLCTLVPTGKHFVFACRPKEGAYPIQKTAIDCPVFTREHISVVSKINPDELYDTLGNLNLPNIVLKDMVDDKGKSICTHSARFFTTKNLSENTTILAPIFRCMQNSPFKIKKTLPGNYLNAPVSKIGKDNAKTLDQWLDTHLKNVTRLNTQTYEIETVKHNLAINAKKQKYVDDLQQNKIKFNNERTGFGFITFPILNNIKKHLDNMDVNELQKLIRHVIKCLDSFPQFTKSLSFLAVPAKHFNRTQETKEKLIALFSSKMNKEALTRYFCDIIYNYAAYLDKQNSDRCLKMLNETFMGIEKILTTRNNAPPASEVMA